MKTADFDFHLPESFIANSPAAARDHCKLMVFNTATGEIFHKKFYEITEFLLPNDVLVVNRSKVVPARLLFEIDGKVREIFLLQKIGEFLYQAMVRPGKFFKKGKILKIDENFCAEVRDIFDDGTRLIKFSGIDVENKIRTFGKIPLPPYIKNSLDDPSDYQTIYAKEEGSIAAPTAGLHFTKKLFDEIDRAGILRREVVLHVGRGTFMPVSSEKLENHIMHSEVYEMPLDAAEKLNGDVRLGRRIFAVGTTSVRVLESNFSEGKFHSGIAETDIFIYPGKYKWKIVDGLITNFHLPKSTLIMLTASFLESKGVECPVKKILELYEIAKNHSYRFYSFGDAMLLI